MLRNRHQPDRRRRRRGLARRERHRLAHLAGALSRADRAASGPERGRDGAGRGPRSGPGGGRAGRRPRPAAGLQVQGRGPDRHPAPRGGRRARAQGREDRDQVAARVGGAAGPRGDGRHGDPWRGRRRAPASRRRVRRAPEGPGRGEAVMRRLPPLPRLPNALLGLLTLDCFGGPLVLWLVVRGGASVEWPPDRAIEWLVAGVVVTSAAALFLACITIG